ncbi:MAG: thiamine phosphate synthase [Deltaproteobacteria bacterium]|nr:thiamine phosphate synthase [Deltaproteobacteria bacterium]
MNFNLYCFSPGQFLRGRDPVEIVAAQIRGGADVIQLREKEMSRRTRLELGFQLRDLTRKYGVLFIVNDDVDLALILDADGVHLGQDDIPLEFARPLLKDKIIGISTHSSDQIKKAVAAGADYIGVGPVFDTATKQNRGSLVGLDLIAVANDISSIPYVAIGGIKKDNIKALVDTGCRRAAVISDILTAPDIENQCRLLKGLLLTPS